MQETQSLKLFWGYESPEHRRGFRNARDFVKVLRLASMKGASKVTVINLYVKEYD